MEDGPECISVAPPGRHVHGGICFFGTVIAVFLQLAWTMAGAKWTNWSILAMAEAAAPMSGQFFSVVQGGVSAGSNVVGDSLQQPLQSVKCFYKHWTLLIKSLSA